MKLVADQLEDVLGGKLEGDYLAEVHSFAEISSASENALTYLPKNADEQLLYKTKASVVVVNRDFAPSQDVGATLIRVDDAEEAFKCFVKFYDTHLVPRVGIHPTAVIETSASIGENCYIGPHVYIGEGVVIGNNTQIYANSVVEKCSRIGDECTLYPSVTIYRNCRIGDRVVLQSGCVVGSDGCRYTFLPDGLKKIPQNGQVVIEDDVELGANTCIDRCVRGKTIIHKNCVVGNLVQIGHDCEIGAYTQMSAQVGIAGNTTIGERCVFGGASGVSSDLSVAPNTTIGGRTTILSNVRKEFSMLLGTPAIDRRTFAKASVIYKNLPELYSEFNKMKKELEELKAKQQ